LFYGFVKLGCTLSTIGWLAMVYVIFIYSFSELSFTYKIFAVSRYVPT